MASSTYTLVSDNNYSTAQTQQCLRVSAQQHGGGKYPRVTRGNNRRRSKLVEIRHEHGMYTVQHTAGEKDSLPGPSMYE